MDFDKALKIAHAIVQSPGFQPVVGMNYLLLTEDGKIHGMGTVEEIHEEWGPMSNGAPIDDGWVPDLRDGKTFDICLGWVMLNPTEFKAVTEE